ncbi:MAG: hypothetical protein ABSC18_16690, partial [Verrucomicrobiota bacterium]
GFHGFHGFQAGTPRRGVRSSRRDDPAIRVIREIRGKIFAKMSDFAGLQRKSSFVYAPFVPFCGYSPLPVCSPCNRLLIMVAKKTI